MRLTAGVVSWVCLVLLVGCTASPVEPIRLPPRGASATVVLETYLQAVRARDCSSVRSLVTSTFVVGNGELCGVVVLRAFVIHGMLAQIRADDVEFSTQLTTDGSSDGTVPSGAITWFYELKRHGGQWRLTGGGSGP